MGVLPLEFMPGEDSQTLSLDGSETFEIAGLNDGLKPGIELLLAINRANGERTEANLRVRIDTNIEVEYYRNGGILPYVLRQIVANPS
jgi:aconitate hydratase